MDVQATESDRSLAAFLGDASPEAIWAISPAGVVLSWNPGAERTFGYTSEEVVGSSIFDHLVPADSQEEAERQICLALEAGSCTYETVRRRKDGLCITLIVSMRVVRDAHGHVVCLAVSEMDVTALEAQRQARLLEARFGPLLESTPSALVVSNQAGRILLVNPQAEQLFGYGRRDVVGEPLELLLPERFRERNAALGAAGAGEAGSQPKGRAPERYGVRRDGTEFPAEVKHSTLQVDEGTFVLSAIRDISDDLSERQRLEAARQRSRQLLAQTRRIQEANRLKSAFLANVSHELRTPLNGILGFSELLYDEKVGPVAPEHKEFLGYILISARHLLQLINDVLDLAMVEAGKMAFRPEPVDVRRLVDEVRDVLAAVASEKRVGLSAEVAPALTGVVADPARLKQVLYNYLSNALKFTPHGGRVTVRVAAEGADRFRLEVEDTGIGIRPEDIERLFVEFQQLEASHACAAGEASRTGEGNRQQEAQQGTGLGLALTKRIVEAQGGTVGVHSTPGKGSRFFAVLPRLAGGAQDEPAGVTA